MRRRVVYFGHLPPPIHGVSVINTWIASSTFINDRLQLAFVNLSLSEETRAIGRFSFRKLWMLIRQLMSGLQQLLRTRADLVLYNCSPLGFAFYRDVFLVSVIRIVCRAPIAFYLHGKGYGARAAASNGFYKWSRALFRNSYAICLSDGLREDLKPYTFRRMFTLNNGIPQVSCTKRKPSTFTFLFLSNLIRSKGVLDFVEALVILKKRTTHPFAFALIGEPYDVSREELQRLISEGDLGSEVLAIRAEYGQAKAQWLFERSSVLVLPSHNDCFPLVVLEAMQASLPVISTFQGAIPEIIKDNQSGYLVPEGDKEKLVGRMQSLLEDPVLYDRMSAFAYSEFLARFTFEIFEHNFVRVMTDLITDAGLSRPAAPHVQSLQ